MGIPSVERAVINKQKDGSYNLLVEGTGLQVCKEIGMYFPTVVLVECFACHGS